MTTKSIPEQLRRTLIGHVDRDDLQNDEEMQDILDKLATLSMKVEAAKAQVLSRRAKKKG